MNQLNSKWVLILFLVSSLLGLSFFQNCARSSSTAAIGSLAYSSGVQKISLATNAVVDDNFCYNGRIKCYLKVYSPDVSDSFQNQKKCVLIDGREICFSLDLRSYNTTDAVTFCSDCDSSASLPGGQYNREEVTCWLQVGDSESSPFFALQNNLKDALTENLNSCKASLLLKDVQ